MANPVWGLDRSNTPHAVGCGPAKRAQQPLGTPLGTHHQLSSYATLLAVASNSPDPDVAAFMPVVCQLASVPAFVEIVIRDVAEAFNHSGLKSNRQSVARLAFSVCAT